MNNPNSFPSNEDNHPVETYRNPNEAYERESTSRQTNRELGKKVNESFKQLSQEDFLNVNPAELNATERDDFLSSAEAREADLTARIAALREKLDLPPESTPEPNPESTPELISQEQIKETYELSKTAPAAPAAKNSIIKRANNALKTALAAIMVVGAIAVPGGIVANAIGDNLVGGSKAEQTPSQEGLTGYESLDALIDGSFDQDYNLGCYEDSNKVDQYSVGNPRVVYERLGIDAENATPEQRAAISEYVKHSMKYPAAFEAVAYNYPGFEGLSQIEAENKVANMSDEEKADLHKFIADIYHKSVYTLEDAEGVYRNHGIAEGTDGRHSIFSETDLTGTKILTQRTILDDGTVITTFEKDDCANMLDQVVVQHPDGSSTIITITTENPPSHTDTPPGPGKEWGKSGDPHSGPNRLPSDKVDPASEISQEENDAINRGNQGYIDDNHATPGSGSENNGTGSDGFSRITAGGADTSGGRLSGGEQQGGSQTNGTNPNAPTQGQINRDAGGNAAQNNGNTAGGDNNSNAAEESAVAGGNF